MTLESMCFRFLDLPKELRFMVYENLDIASKELELLPQSDGIQVQQRRTRSPFDTRTSITVSVQTLPVQILSTCRLVYFESLPFLTRKLDKIRDIKPWISIDADCLYTSALDSTQELLCALLRNLDSHSFFTTNPPVAYPSPTTLEAPPTYPREVQQWLTQTCHLLLSQRPPPCPFAGFMGMRMYPTVRLVIEVPKVWKYTPFHGLATEPSPTPRLYTGSVASQLSVMYSGLVEYTKALAHVKSGAIVFDPEDERLLLNEGLVVMKRVALDFGICRVVE